MLFGLIFRVELPGQDSNLDKENQKVFVAHHKGQSQKELATTDVLPLAHTLARESQIDADLALIIKRWSALPAAIRAGIVAMVKATAGLARD